MTQTPAVERLTHLKRLRDDWVAEMETLDGTNAELAHAYVQAIVDLDVLIEDAERQAASEEPS